MFGSEVVAEYVYQVARTTPAVVAAVGDRIVNLNALPSGTGLPALIHYAEAGDYSGTVLSVGADIAEERVRYVTRFICLGESSEPIRLAAQKLLEELAANRPTGELTFAGEHYYLAFVATGEWPLTTGIEEVGGATVIYRQLGTYWTVDVTRS